MQNRPKIKIGLLGPSHAGKTEFRMCASNVTISKQYEPTIGIDLSIVKNANIFEIGGRFFPLVRQQCVFYDSFIVLFDLTQENSLQEVMPYIEILQKTIPNANIVLAGTNAALLEKHKISQAEIELFCQRYHLDHYHNINTNSRTDVLLVIKEAVNLASKPLSDTKPTDPYQLNHQTISPESMQSQNYKAPFKNRLGKSLLFALSFLFIIGLIIAAGIFFGIPSILSAITTSAAIVSSGLGMMKTTIAPLLSHALNYASKHIIASVGLALASIYMAVIVAYIIKASTPPRNNTPKKKASNDGNDFEASPLSGSHQVMQRRLAAIDLISQQIDNVPSLVSGTNIPRGPNHDSTLTSSATDSPPTTYFSPSK